MSTSAGGSENHGKCNNYHSPLTIITHAWLGIHHHKPPSFATLIKRNLFTALSHTSAGTFGPCPHLASDDTSIAAAASVCSLPPWLLAFAHLPEARQPPPTRCQGYPKDEATELWANLQLFSHVFDFSLLPSLFLIETFGSLDLMET